MSHRFGIALVGIGPGAVPHLQSLFDLRDTVELRHAVTRRPALAQLGPFQGLLTPSARKLPSPSLGSAVTTLAKVMVTRPAMTSSSWGPLAL